MRQSTEAVNRNRKYMREYMKERRAQDTEFKARQTKANRKYRARVREEVRELLAEFRKNGCRACPEKDPACLEAHHLRDKNFDLGVAGSMTALRVQEELKKCICLCSNCHKKHHAGRLEITSSLLG